jgi:hypothetical protein
MFFFFFFFGSTFYYATVYNTCTAYLRRSQQVIREEGKEWYERQSTVTLRDHGCGTQPQRTGAKGAGYGRPVRAKLRQGVGPQPSIGGEVVCGLLPCLPNLTLLKE